MKTTIDIANALLSKARALSEREKITLRQLVEEGLRLVLQQYANKKAKRSKIQPHIVRGSLPSPQSWNEIADVLERDRLKQF